jgi:hypothetical protein
MKKILSILILSVGLLFAATTDASAQLTVTRTPTTAKDSLVNADTLYINVTPPANDVAGIHCIGTRATGTLAGSVTLQGSLDGTNWATVDTAVTLTNAAYMLVTFPVTAKLPYSRYRFTVITSGTVKVTGIRGVLIRRS